MPPARSGAFEVQGRRFNGRPAVSKTASGGSNPSAPAKPLNGKSHMAEELTLTQKAAAWPTRVKDYVDELRLEMRRVTWPAWKQVRATTGVVIAAVFVF